MARGLFGRSYVAEEAEVVVTTAPEAATPIEFIDTPEAALVAMSETQGEIEQTLEDMDEAGDVADSLTDIVSGAEEVVANDGGYSEGAMRTMDVAVEALVNSIQLRGYKKVSLEAFAKPETRISATKLAIEGWKETVKTIWDNIVKAFEVVKKSVTEFFKKLMDATVSYKKRAEQILAQAKAKEGQSAPADAEMDATSFAKFIHVGGVVPTGKDIASGLKEAAKSQVVVDKAIREYLDEVRKQLASDKDFAGQDSPPIILHWSDDNLKPENFTVPDDSALFTQKLPFADKGIFVTIKNRTPKVEARGEKTVLPFNSKYFINNVAGAKEASTDKVKPLTVKEIKDIVAGCNEVLEHFKTASSIMEAAGADIKAAEENGKKYKDMTDEDKQNTFLAISRRLHAFVTFSSNQATASKSYCMQCVKGSLDYCAKSLALITPRLPA